MFKHSIIYNIGIPSSRENIPKNYCKTSHQIYELSNGICDHSFSKFTPDTLSKDHKLILRDFKYILKKYVRDVKSYEPCELIVRAVAHRTCSKYVNSVWHCRMPLDRIINLDLDMLYEYNGMYNIFAEDLL